MFTNPYRFLKYILFDVDNFYKIKRNVYQSSGLQAASLLAVVPGEIREEDEHRRPVRAGRRTERRRALPIALQLLERFRLRIPDIWVQNSACTFPYIISKKKFVVFLNFQNIT